MVLLLGCPSPLNSPAGPTAGVHDLVASRESSLIRFNGHQVLIPNVDH